MSSFSNSSLNDSTSNPPNGSERTFTPFTPQFGSMSPVFNPDGSLKGIYDLQGNFFFSTSETTRGSRNSYQTGLRASPTLVNASSPMGNMAGGVSMRRGLISDGGIPISVENMAGSTTEQNRMMRGVQGSPHVYSMSGSSYPATGGHSQNHVQAMNSLSSMSFMNDMNSNYTSPLQLGTMDLHHKELMMQSQQLSMAMPGEINFGGVSTSHHLQQLQHAQAVSTGLRSTDAAMGYDQPLQQYHQHQNTSQYRVPQVSPIGQPFRDVGSKPMQATTQPSPDPFGMLSLLSVINKTNPDLTTLAMGIDLTTLGLDMTSKEKLFKTFASPWANEPLKDDFEFTIPQCYNAIQHPPPHQGTFRRYNLTTLFYIFYSMPKDEAQLYAADELYNRGWFYHKEDKCWFKRIGEPLEITNAYEIGTYECFDPDEFMIVQKENELIDYEMLEKRPSLPQHRV